MNGKKIATIAMGAVALGVLGAQEQANAATKIDDNHVEVQAGDSLSQIADEYGTTVDVLARNNNIANKNLIHIGDKLTITLPDNNNNTQKQVQPQQAPVATQNTTTTQQAPIQAPAQNVTTGGSVHDQFIAAGGTEAMWNSIVMPESGGNPNATNGQYSGLGQTNQSWGTGSVASQTQGMINYANSRYGSIANAINFRNANGYW
jgi:hypothetical protein